MTTPRHIVPGALLMVTMRCVQRLFKLAPSREVNEIVEYLLAHESTKYGVGPERSPQGFRSVGGFAHRPRRSTVANSTRRMRKLKRNDIFRAFAR